jgi:hypothetical protein
MVLKRSLGLVKSYDTHFRRKNGDFVENQRHDSSISAVILTKKCKMKDSGLTIYRLCLPRLDLMY